MTSTLLLYNRDLSTSAVLEKVLEKPELGLLHASCHEISAVIKHILNNENNFPNENSKPDVNQIRIDHKMYRLSSEQLDALFATLAVNNDIHFKKKKNILRGLIDDGLSSIKNKTSSSKYIHIFKAFSQYDNLSYFIHDYIQHLFVVTKETNYKFKVTSTCINFSDTLIRYIVAQIPYLRCIDKCFDNVDSLYLRNTEIKFIIAFIKLIFDRSIDDNLVKRFFKEYNIDNKHIMELIINHFKELFLKSGLRNTIYNDDIKNVVASYVKNYPNLKAFFTENQRNNLTLGYYWFSLMTNDKGLSIIDEFIPKKNKYMKMFVPSIELIEDVFLTRVQQKPYLHEKQLKKPIKPELEPKPQPESEPEPKLLPKSYQEIIEANIKKLIHGNAKIEISLKDNCYLRKVKPSTKLSINIDPLKGYLMRLCNNTKTLEEWLAILNVNKYYLKDLRGIHEFFTHVIDTIILPAICNFHTRISSQSLKELIKAEFITFTSKDQEEIYLTTLEQVYQQYSSKLFELCDNCCHRKNQHVDYVAQCIYYSIYKYFLTTIFIDTRSRAYMYLVHLNILTNPSAKMFVNLYDPNEGTSISSTVLLFAESFFTFKQTKNKIAALLKNTRDELKTINKTKIYEYILTYLNITMEEFKNIIKNNNYSNYDFLMNYLLTVIKKPKRLHYVHSLIYYEHARYRNVHNNIICNYYEKDGSSSGYQVMAGVFNSYNLAIMANLSGTEDYKLYYKAINYSYTNYKNMLNIATVMLNWLSSSDILETHQSGFNLNYDPFTQEEFQLAVDASASGSFETLITLLIKVNFNTSPIIIDILHAMSMHLDSFIKKNKEYDDDIQKIFEDLPKSYHKIYNMFNKKLRFENLQNALKLVLSLRYSVRICYISERVLQISHNEDSLWYDRELSKDAIMTRLYGSTAYGRKDKIKEKLMERFLMPKASEFLFEEFANFIQKSVSKFLNYETEINILDEFADTVCGEKEIIIENRNFIITLAPRKSKDFQVSCSTFSGRRGAQLVIKEFSPEIDKEKLRSMFLANFAHSMDADIMHHFTEIIIELNKWFKDRGYKFRLIYERNHDCFFTNCPFLLEIVVEEAYLRFFAQNNIKNIKNIAPNIIKRFQERSPEEFLKLLDPINPYFIK